MTDQWNDDIEFMLIEGGWRAVHVPDVGLRLQSPSEELLGPYDLLTREEVMELTGWSERTMKRTVESGQVVSVPIVRDHGVPLTERYVFKGRHFRGYEVLNVLQVFTDRHRIARKRARRSQLLAKSV